jgi:hypothetical protein
VLDAYVAANGLLLGENGGSKNAILSIDGPLCDALCDKSKTRPRPTYAGREMTWVGVRLWRILFCRDCAVWLLFIYTLESGNYFYFTVP